MLNNNCLQWGVKGANINQIMESCKKASGLVRLRERNGQTMVEYVITAGVLVAAVAILAVFLYTFRENSGRVLDLVASEYP